MKHSILIDGGGSLNNSYDVGKSTLLPYLLDRKVTKIDYMFVSHFDQDHVGGLLTVMQEIKVKNIIIGKQFEDSENLQKFSKIVKEKGMNVEIVDAGAKIKIEKNLYFDILWPDTQYVVTEKSLNNNALVCKLYYNNFTMLFTGDIEEIAEKELVNIYKKTSLLQSTVLKVAHHGSKSSSTEELLKLVQPQIALIGVGKNNLYGHPAEQTIRRLEGERS